METVRTSLEGKAIELAAPHLSFPDLSDVHLFDFFAPDTLHFRLYNQDVNWDDSHCGRGSTIAVNMNGSIYARINIYCG
jgi:hypothetical protein